MLAIHRRVPARRRLCASLVVAIIALGASSCGSSNDEDAKPAVPELTDETRERHVQISISGAKELKFSKRVPVRFLYQQGTAGEQNVSVYSVTIPELASVDETTKLLPDIAVFADYKGEGKYKVHAGAGTPEPRTGPTAPKREADPRNQDNHVAVTVITTGPNPKETKYGYALTDCTIVIDDDSTGSATCQKLASLDGEQVAFKMTWSK